jgi:hypothetical protein
VPRPRKQVQPEANAIVASAAHVTSKRLRGQPKTQGVMAWQAEVRDMLYETGELEFYREWVANSLSRVRLHVVEVTTQDGKEHRRRLGPNEEEPDAQRAYAALDALFGGEAGQAGMLATMAVHLNFPGETWLVGLLADEIDPDLDRWRVLARNEIRNESGRWVIERGDGLKESYADGSKDGVPAEAYVARIWEPDPFEWVAAHSSVRSALPILREMQGLTKKVAADIDSRLAGAGVLVVPSEVTFTPPPGIDLPTDPQSDPFLSTLIQTMLTAIRDRGDASAVAPILMRVPAQYVQHVKHLTFWSEFSAEARELRNEALRRLANSLACPGEVLTGMGDINHWGQWFTDENGIKMYVEPTAGTITSGLTSRYLWPCMQGDAPTFNPALRRFVFEADTSALRQRPDKSADAAALHDANIITDAAYARERGGFEGDDLLKPGSEEYVRRLLQKLANGVTTGDMTVAALEALGVTLEPKPSEVAKVDPGVTVEQVPNGTPPAIEAPAPPGPPAEPTDPGGEAVAAAVRQAQLTALVLGAEGIVHRAIERGWSRARGGAVRRPVRPDQLDAALAGAWERVPRVAAMTGVDGVQLREALDTYTRAVLETGAEHDPAAFATLLQQRLLPTSGALS